MFLDSTGDLWGKGAKILTGPQTKAIFGSDDLSVKMLLRNELWYQNKKNQEAHRR